MATLESTPRNATYWSRASMAERSGLSTSTIGRIWRTFELKPHRAVEFKKFLIKIDKEVPADQTLESIARLMKRTTGAGH